MSFGQRLRKLRKERELSQEELARILETDRSNIANWETRRQPDYEVVKKIAAYFNVTTDYLLGLVDEKGQSVEMQTKTTDGRIIEGIKLMEELTEEEQQKVLIMLYGLKAKADLEKKLKNKK